MTQISTFDSLNWSISPLLLRLGLRIKPLGAEVVSNFIS